MPEPQPDVLRAEQALADLDARQPSERVAALESAAAALDAALADNAD